MKAFFNITHVSLVVMVGIPNPSLQRSSASHEGFKGLRLGPTHLTQIPSRDQSRGEPL